MDSVRVEGRAEGRREGREGIHYPTSQKATLALERQPHRLPAPVGVDNVLADQALDVLWA